VCVYVCVQYRCRRLCFAHDDQFTYLLFCCHCKVLIFFFFFCATNFRCTNVRPGSDVVYFESESRVFYKYVCLWLDVFCLMLYSLQMSKWKTCLLFQRLLYTLDTELLFQLSVWQHYRRIMDCVMTSSFIFCFLFTTSFHFFLVTILPSLLFIFSHCLSAASIALFTFAKSAPCIYFNECVKIETMLSYCMCATQIFK